MEHKNKIPILLRILFLGTFLFAIVSTTTAQTQIKLPDRKITVTEALKILQSQTSLSQVLNTEYLDMNMEINTGKNEVTLDELVRAIFEPQRVKYEITDTSIVILGPDNGNENINATKTNSANQSGIPERDFTLDERTSYNGKYSVVSVNIDTRKNETKGTPKSNPTAPLPIVTKHVSKFAIKTNFLYAATLTPNAGIEFALGKKSTMDISGGYNFYKPSSGKQWRHWMVQPEYRYWFCERFNGLFLGGHLLGGQFNFSKIDFPFNVLPDLKDYRYEGEFIGAGVVFGHQWMLGKRFNLEMSIGAGYVRVMYDKFGCNTCGPAVESGNKNYFGPTKAAISLLFFL